MPDLRINFHMLPEAKGPEAYKAFVQAVEGFSVSFGHTVWISGSGGYRGIDLKLSWEELPIVYSKVKATDRFARIEMVLS
jgi:hypothetical protein